MIAYNRPEKPRIASNWKDVAELVLSNVRGVCLERLSHFDGRKYLGIREDLNVIDNVRVTTHELSWNGEDFYIEYFGKRGNIPLAIGTAFGLKTRDPSIKVFSFLFETENGLPIRDLMNYIVRVPENYITPRIG